MSARFRLALAVSSAFALLVCSPAAAATPEQDPKAPETYVELYNLTMECMFYFGRMHEGLEQAGAPEKETEPYGEMGGTLPWLLVALAEVMSEDDLSRSTPEQALEQRLDGFDDLYAMKDAYDTRCITAYEKFDNYTRAIQRRLEEKSGEPYLDLKGECVTVSTSLMSVTGLYLGMVGPSVTEVPRGGLRIPDPGSGDRYKVLLPRGTVADWNAMQLPPPPDMHTRLLAMTPEDQAATLAEALHKIRRDCKRPDKPFFRGRDNWGRAHWAVGCRGNEAFALSIDEENDLRFSYDCDWAKDRSFPECYESCAGIGCYDTDPSVNATVEHVPYAASIRVERAPDKYCAEMDGTQTIQFRGDLPELKQGAAHELVMTFTDTPDCASLESDPRLTLEIHSTRHLDMLKVDLSTLEIPHMRLEDSAEPPCELVHVDPVDTEYADLRCRLVAEHDRDWAVEAGLSVRGRFYNGDPFHGQCTACAPSVQ